MAITYQIQAGDTVQGIAQRFGLDLSKLLSLNPWLDAFKPAITPSGPAGPGGATITPAGPAGPGSRLTVTPRSQLTIPDIPIQGAGVQLERRPEQSPAVSALMGGEGGDIQAALSFVLGEGVGQTQAGLLQRLTPELTAAFEGVNASILAQTEQAGMNAISAPTLTPLEFIQSLQRTGTLAAMMRNPTLTGTRFAEPAITSRRLRF